MTAPTVVPLHPADAHRGRERALLLLILLAGLAVRVFGVRWGLPDRVDLNPDEATVLTVVSRLSRENWDPGVYFYSGFSFHLLALVQWLARLIRPSIEEPALVVLCRGVSVAFGTATIGVLFGLVRRVAPTGPAPLIGAAFLALMPLHVWDSHFATTDVTLTFWMLAAVSASVWAYQGPSRLRFMIASALVGVASGVKFNGAFASVAVAVAGLAAVWERRVSLGRLLWWGCQGLGAAILALFLASPHTFLQWRATLAAFEHEMERVHIHDYGFNLWVPGWQYKPYVYQFAAAFPFSFGLAVYATVLGGLVYCAMRFRRPLLVPFGYAGFYLGVMGSWDFVPIRYYLPFEPVLLLPPALMLAAGLEAEAVRVRRLTIAVLVIVLVYTAAFTISTTARFTHDTRIQSQRWLEPRVAEGRSVLAVGASWYLPTPRDRKGVTILTNYGVMVGEVKAKWPDYVVLTGLQYIRSYRERDANVQLWDTIRRGVLPYRLAKRFQARYLNWRFYTTLDPMYEGYFISPTIEIYARVTPSAPPAPPSPPVGGGGGGGGGREVPKVRASVAGGPPRAP